MKHDRITLINIKKGFIMFKIAVICIALIAIVGCGEHVASYQKESISNFSKPSSEMILEAINRARAQSIDCHDGFGVREPVEPLHWNSKLYASAYEHSRDLAGSDTFSHLGSGTEYDITGYNIGKKSLFFERIEENGYQNYNIVGENIAGGQNNLDKLMKDLLNSPKHCANIMNKKFKEIGVAVVTNENSRYKIYWTQNFGG